MSASEKRKPWRCNVCLVALFDDYDDALAHEGKCDARTTTAAEFDIASGVAMSTGASEAEPSEADAGPSTPPNHENDAIPICPLCCDEGLTSTGGRGPVHLPELRGVPRQVDGEGGIVRPRHGTDLSLLSCGHLRGRHH